MLKGLGYDFILDLDLVSFDSLVQCVFRVDAAEKIENAWTGMIAAQAGSKDMKGWTKRWHQIASGDSDTNDEVAFKARFGQGF